MPTNGPAWQVRFTPRVTAELRYLGLLAMRLGKLGRFRYSLLSVRRRLTHEPLTCGDPNFRLHQLGLTMYNGVIGLLHCHYAVDESRRTVYVQRVMFLPGVLAE